MKPLCISRETWSAGRFCHVIKITVWRLGVGSKHVSEAFPNFGPLLFYFIFNPSLRRCLCRALGAGQAAGSQDPLPGVARRKGCSPGVSGQGQRVPHPGRGGHSRRRGSGFEQPPPVCLSTSEVRDPTHTLQSPSTYRARHTLAAATHRAHRAPGGSAQCSGAAGRGLAVTAVLHLHLVL